MDNLWARRGRAAPALVFAGHTDVVPSGPREQWDVDPFAATVADGHSIGRGAADMKGSLAAMVNACRRFAAQYPRRAGLTRHVDHERRGRRGRRRHAEGHGDARGARRDSSSTASSASRRAHARLGDTVRVGRRGSLSGIMTIRGVQGHVAYPLQSDNPIHALAKFVSRDDARADRRGQRAFSADDVPDGERALRRGRAERRAGRAPSAGSTCATRTSGRTRRYPRASRRC